MKKRSKGCKEWSKRKRVNKISDLVHRIGYYAAIDGKAFSKRFPKIIKAIERMVTDKPGMVIIDKRRLEQLEEIEWKYNDLSK
jgi:hypothetical protein